MESKFLSISQTADKIGVSIQTLRRWDEAGKLRALREKRKGHRYYREDIVEDFIKDNMKNLFKLAKKWAGGDSENELPTSFYCQDISVFQARLSRLEGDLGKVKKMSKIFPLITAIVGEIGNNSFDHNLGNWPDMPGIFFAYDLGKGQIVLADRGQGILATLKKARLELKNHEESLRVAFTEIISGRAPEYRGNGLKFVKDVVCENEISLLFQSGDAELMIEKKTANLDIKKSNVYLRGCLALIKF